MRNLTFATFAAVALMGAPAIAQSTLDELTITGQFNPRNGPPATLSERVSYADLDLTSAAGRDELNLRVRAAATDVCKRVGAEPTGFQNLSSSCEQIALRDAMSQVRRASADARTTSYAKNASYPVDAYSVGAYPVGAYSADASATMSVVSSGPVPDTAANRARYGGPMSTSGRRTRPAGN